MRDKCFNVHWLLCSCSCSDTDFFAVSLAVESIEELLSCLLLLLLRNLLKKYLTQCNANVSMHADFFPLALVVTLTFCSCCGCGVYWTTSEFFAVLFVVESIEELHNTMQHKCFNVLMYADFFALALVVESFEEQLSNTNVLMYTDFFALALVLTLTSLLLL